MIMKIFQVIPRLEEGGAERFVVDLCNALTENYSCHIVLIVFYNLDRNNILVKELSHSVDIIEMDKKPGFDLSIVRKLNHLVKDQMPDVIQTHLNAFEYMFYNIFMYRKRINFVNTIHTSPKWLYDNKIIKFVNYLIYRIAGVTPVVISSDSVTEFNKMFPKIKPVLIFNGRPEVKETNNVETVQNEVESYKKTLNTKVFINVATICTAKNHLMLVNAFNQLIGKGEDIILLVVGSHQDKKIIDNIKEKINDRIYLLGYKDNPTDYLSCSDAFCLSSFYEGMPISLIEAIQIGVIPICTPAGGVNDIINSSFGFVSNDYSISSYVESLKAFLELDETQRKEMSSKARIEYENNYTMKITVSKYYQLYKG